MVLDDSLPMWGFVGKLEKIAPAGPAEAAKHRCGGGGPRRRRAPGRAGLTSPGARGGQAVALHAHAL
jgi:hypothetical protein